MFRWLCCLLVFGLAAENQVSARTNPLLLAQEDQTDQKPLIWNKNKPKTKPKPKPKQPVHKPGTTGKKKPASLKQGKGKPSSHGKPGKNVKEAPVPAEPTAAENNTEKASSGNLIPTENSSESGTREEAPSGHVPAIPQKPSDAATAQPSSNAAESMVNPDPNKTGITIDKPSTPGAVPTTSQPPANPGMTTESNANAQASGLPAPETKADAQTAALSETSVPQGTAFAQRDSLFRMSLTGGVLLLRSMRIDPNVMLMCDFNVGRFLGWHGLYVGLEIDSYIGTSLFGTSYLMFDGLLGFRGRFGWSKIKLLGGLGAGIRYMILLGNTEGTSESPELGFGGEATAGVEFDITSWLYLVVRASGRYMKEPLAPRFQFSSVFGAGVGFSF